MKNKNIRNNQNETKSVGAGFVPAQLKRNTQNAITIVALIITIIILLILVTVSISLVINNNILDKAQNGVDKYSEEEELEQIKLAVASAMLKGNGFLDTDNLNSELHERIDENENAEKRENTWYYKEYIIDESGKVEKYDKLLPREFKQVEYIESTGTQWIDTKIIPKATLNGKFDLMCMDYGYPFGSTNGQNIDYWGMNFYKYNNSMLLELYLGTGSYPKVSTWQVETRYLISIIDKKFYCDNKLLYDFNQTNNGFNFYTNKSIYLFGLNYNGGAYKKMRFYSATFFDNNGLIKDFIPCYCTTTVTNVDGDECDSGTIGLYDMVEGKFYTNKGSGAFSKGNEV